MNGNAPAQRPLSEIGPMERRRNSPSFNQTAKNMMFNGDSSPFDPSPFNASNSPRLYWQSRDPASPSRLSMENKNPMHQREHSPSTSKRSSIENLKRASRVKNSNMFAREHKQEYDPASVAVIERPLATRRPLSVQVQSTALGSRGVDGSCKDFPDDDSKIPVYSPTTPSTTEIDEFLAPISPSKGQVSPAKSSLSNRSRFTAQAQALDTENGAWSEDEESSGEHQLPPGRGLHRHAKSVTFDAAPPQINEYEMTTPDPSSVASGSREGSYDSADAGEEDESSDRGSSLDRDDSFDASLEDTDKTPVVLPEDWRFMSPGLATENLAANVEDPFDGEESSPAPTAQPISAADGRPTPSRTDSTNSNGERRPLPPLPPLGMPSFQRARSDSNNTLSATAERISSAQRGLPSPPGPASVSKAEIQGMSGCSMSLQDRLRLMMLEDEEKNESSADDRADITKREEDEKAPGVQICQDQEENDDVASLGEYKLPPRISRESILRKVKGQARPTDDMDFDYSSPAPSSSPERKEIAGYDPDTPLPSLEGQSVADDVEDNVFIKQEDGEESEVDVYSIPDLYRQHPQTVLVPNGYEQESSVVRHQPQGDDYIEDDDESHYSHGSTDEEQSDIHSSSASQDEGAATPRAHTPTRTVQNDSQLKENHTLSLPEFASMLGENDLGLGLKEYLRTSPPPSKQDRIQEHPPTMTAISDSVQRPVTPEQQLELPRFPGYCSDPAEGTKTPDSVIRHPVEGGSPLPESPSVPEPVATIKAPGGRLKTRPSATPADIASMATVRRQVSGQQPIIPPIPERHRDRPSLSGGSEATDTRQDGVNAIDTDLPNAAVEEQTKRKSSLVQLEVPMDGMEEGLSFGLDKEFDRVIEAQKVAFDPSPTYPGFLSGAPAGPEYIGGQGFRPITKDIANKATRTQKGYLMRQNTKVVVATSNAHEPVPESVDTEVLSGRGTKSAGNSPRKASQTQTWTTEPWNGKPRRKSVRQSAGSPQKKSVNGPAPPLPGQQSNVASGLGRLTEDTSVPVTEENEEGVERGRLFVKVVGVKDLDLPLPKGERSYFALTLDNGLHCVTTAWLELGKSAPIGQEFELVVLNDLEFQLTLQTKLEEPQIPTVIESVFPTKAAKAPKQSTFSRVFTSPKKRKELEIKQQEEANQAARQKQQDVQARRLTAQPTAWDLLHGLVARDGSFARSYVCLKDHETRAYGRPYTVDVPCFNEWATEEVTMGSSVKSKRSVNGVVGIQRRPPYRIGKLELQLLFVPKPKGATDEEMPKSMNACVRELKDAECSATKQWEGNLSQQGGDCPYWRRRFFKLEASKLTAYHESTRQPRATINLAKASKLIDDKSALMKKEISGKGGSRRKSAFAEEEEGYMFVEEGFRVRFANGETIDFYADSAADKEGWMKVLADVVGKESASGRGWTGMVLAREKQIAARKASAAQQGQMRPPPARTAPPTPAKPNFQAPVPSPAERSPRHQNPQHNRANMPKTRSMIF
ncbi:MAG: Bud site selection protein bud4 [Pleopsidium flavum]|nr:MAG: Bud site selection protein bud4 [Pleopsidium flavum]